MKLLIVESPSKAKTIEKYLGGDFLVRASVGHIRDLPKSNKKAVDIANGFTPNYEMSKGKEEVVSELKKLAKKAEEIYLATDPDREGEAIAWHIAEVIGLKKPQRVTYNEITKEAVQEALLKPRPIDMKLKEAQEARRVLDRLVGYDLSGLIWKKLRYGLSAGRVQSPALRILMEREREIRAFIPETYFVLSAEVAGSTKVNFLVTSNEEPRDKARAELIKKTANEGDWIVKEVSETKVARSARAPFTTSTLQQAGSSRLGFSPGRTMRAAQKLYEKGFITYMRTDSTTLSSQALKDIADAVQKEFGKEYLETRQYTGKAKNAQEAHEAVRPTKAAKISAGNNEDEKRVYTLIRERAVSSQMKDAEILRTKITAIVGGEDMPEWSANGSRVLFPGWLLCDKDARGEDVELPKVADGEKLDCKGVNLEEKQTEPPSRYSEAGLIKELEKRGIGRPSTYASIVDTLEDRGYVSKNGRTLLPTETGDVVSSFLEKHFEKYISDDFTAEMETELDEIAEGKRSYAKTLGDFYKPFAKDVKSKEKLDKITNLGDAPEEFLCPECGSKMIWKLGRSGRFMSCDKFPDCDGARLADGSIMEDAKPIGTDPKTGLPILLLQGKFGPFVQIGEKDKKTNPKPRRASVPKEKDLSSVSVEDALKYLSLPRELGNHPDTGKMISANIGRFGPYIVHEADFRSLKTDDPHTIELPRALEILKEEKKKRGFRKKKVG
ncbi:MAG: type I DNA topoisomerase [Patescibacteria group bacterium]